MTRAWLLIVAVGVVGAAALFATCEGGRDATNALRPTDPAEVSKPAAHERTKSPAVEAAPDDVEPGAPSPAAAAALVSATTVFSPPDVKLAVPEHLLRGHVVNPRGEPIAGADVHLFSLWLPYELAGWYGRYDEYLLAFALSRQTTGADGSFALRYWEGGPRGLIVTSHGFRWFGHDLGDETEHVIVLADEPRLVTVRVVRASDRSPITDVPVVVRLSQRVLQNHEIMEYPGVRLELAPSAPGAWTTRDAAAGMAILKVAALGFRSEDDKWIDIPESGDAVVEVPLDVAGGGTIHGTVVDDETGNAIPDADVAFGDTWPGVRTWCGPDGRFQWKNLNLSPRSRQPTIAGAPGYADTVAFAEVTYEHATECDITIRLQRPAAVAVRCIDGDGHPLAKVFVAAFSGYDEWDATTDTSAATTGTDGRATVQPLHPGADGIALRTRFYVDGVPVLERTFPPLRPGETRDLGDVVIAPTLTLRGTVLDADGKPVGGATVAAAPNDPANEQSAAGSAFADWNGRRAETSADGTFTLVGLAPGLWDLFAARQVIGSEGRLEKGVDAKRGSITLRLPRVVALAARVVDAHGTPLAKAHVQAMSTDVFGRRLQKVTNCDDEGRFSFDDYADDAPDVEITVLTAKGAPLQTFKLRPGAAAAELRLR